MIALVLTFDRNASLTEHMLLRYREVWPEHPFVFRIPYQDESRLEENWGDPRPDRRHWVKSPPGIPETMEALLSDLDPGEWIYWCIDDKYPEALHRPTFEAITTFLLSTHRGASDRIGGLEAILPCRARQMLNRKNLGGPVPRDFDAPVPLLWRASWHQIWLHQFLRPRVLRQLFSGMPSDIPVARAMDAYKFEVPVPPGLAVTERNAVRFGESLSAGEVLYNTILRFRELRQPLPPHLPLRLNKAVTMGHLPPTMSERFLRFRHRALMRVLRLRWGRTRLNRWIRHVAGWEMVQALRVACPSGDFTFFDIGSNNGSSSITYAAWFPRAKGVLFEAHPAIAERAVARVTAAGLAHRLTVLPLGLSNRSGTADFHVSTANEAHELVRRYPDRPEGAPNERIMGSGSLLAPDAHKALYPDIEFGSTEVVSLKRADDWLREAPDHRPPTFLHIDTQGSELLVLEGFGAALSQVQVVWMEVSRVPLYQSQPLVADVSRWMRNHGFVLAVDAVGTHWGDQLWVKDEVWNRARSPFRQVTQQAIDFQRLRIRKKPY